MANRSRKGQTRRYGYVWLALILGFAVVIFFLNFRITLAPDTPRLTSHVLDDANILTLADRNALNDELAAVDRGGGPQIVVATEAKLDHASLAEDGIEIARRFRIGHAGRNDGVLLLIVQDERKARIEVGYGLEGVLTDAASRIIIDDKMEAHLRASEWGDAARGGVDGILAVVTPASGAAPATSRPPSETAPQPVETSAPDDSLHDLGQTAGLLLFAGVFVLLGLGFFQAVALAIPGVERGLLRSRHWSWIARWRVLGSRGGGGGSSDRDESSSSASSTSSSSDSYDSGGSFGGGGAND